MCFSRLSLVVTFSLALQSCASVVPRNAVPEELVGEAMVLPGTHARMWGDEVFDGQQVGPDHAVCDGDTIELHF